MEPQDALLQQYREHHDFLSSLMELVVNTLQEAAEPNTGRQARYQLDKLIGPHGSVVALIARLSQTRLKCCERQWSLLQASEKKAKAPVHRAASPAAPSNPAASPSPALPMELMAKALLDALTPPDALPLDDEPVRDTAQQDVPPRRDDTQIVSTEPATPVHGSSTSQDTPESASDASLPPADGEPVMSTSPAPDACDAKASDAALAPENDSAQVSPAATDHHAASEATPLSGNTSSDLAEGDPLRMFLNLRRGGP